MPVNERERIVIRQPTTLAKRAEVCTQMCHKLHLKLPALVDTLDDAVNRAYGAWPDRLYLVSKDGRIAFQGAPGPAGFRPEALRAAIEKELGRR